jgi:alanyl-tRNA synthetase
LASVIHIAKHLTVGQSIGIKTEMKTANDIRKEFLGYFENHGHKVVPSSPLVPQNDPTLMFVATGMVQFKDVFTGKETRDYKRATTSQKCVRAGGKHNDLDNVGYTARHHTFFEMLGNFSFGDYFKEDAISMAWELVTQNFELPKDRLLVTVHSSDEEAAKIWKKVTGFSDNKIIKIPTSDNFWAMGDTGPCGPCTEIFYDHGDHIPGGPPGSPDEDGDRFVEIWNNVFMQFEQIDEDTRIDLPAPSVDTGMGLERIAAILQGKHDNYDIDLFRSIIEHSAEITNINPDGEQAASHRVIADHLRCSAFLIADGVMPSNEGRGYVLRRIMRRGMRHAHLLGAEDPLLFQLLPTLIDKMGQAYPELVRAQALISETLKIEETRFKKTLDRGLKLLDEEVKKLSSGKQFPGHVAFKLYDTYGFPVDLTQDALRAQNIEIDMNGFSNCMEEQKDKARKSWAGSGDSTTEKIWFEVLENCGSTEFLGYESEISEGKIVALIKDGKPVDFAEENDDVQILVNQTPFYAESGGQVGDKGIMLTSEGCAISIHDVKKQVHKLWVHHGTVSKGKISTGDAVEMRVDSLRRKAIKSNHSATHLMHESLRRVLGEHVSQKGSYQDDERTRFDISHPSSMTEDQISAVEQLVNQQIQANTSVNTRVMSLEDAMESGAMALFGEKYDDEVRVVTMGTEEEGANKAFSVELCGGTHVKRTGDIGLFKILSESALASGVRRIEALTGNSALKHLEQQEQRLKSISSALKTGPADVYDRIKSLIDEKKKLEQQVTELRKQLATGGGSNDKAGIDIKNIDGLAFTGKILENFPPRDLKPMADEIKAQMGSGIVTLIANNDGKASIVVGVTDDLTEKINAVELVKIGALALGGKGGGGRPDMAQAGGPNCAAANDALAAIEKALSS